MQPLPGKMNRTGSRMPSHYGAERAPARRDWVHIEVWLHKPITSLCRTSLRRGDIGHRTAYARTGGVVDIVMFGSTRSAKSKKRYPTLDMGAYAPKPYDPPDGTPAVLSQKAMPGGAALRQLAPDLHGADRLLVVLLLVRVWRIRRQRGIGFLGRGR